MSYPLPGDNAEEPLQGMLYQARGSGREGGRITAHQASKLACPEFITSIVTRRLLKSFEHHRVTAFEDR